MIPVPTFDHAHPVHLEEAVTTFETVLTLSEMNAEAATEIDHSLQDVIDMDLQLTEKGHHNVPVLEQLKENQKLWPSTKDLLD